MKTSAITFLRHLGVILSISVSASPAFAAPDDSSVAGKVWREQEEFEVEAPTLAIITHSTNYWDANESSKNGAQRLADALLTFNKTAREPIPMFYLVHDLNQSYGYFYNQFKQTGVILSYGGDHGLKPISNRIILAGGFFDQCLCRTIRDLLIATQDQAGPIEFVLVTDAIYLYHQSIKSVGWGGENKSVSLEEMVAPLNDTQYGEFMITELFTDSQAGICEGTYATNVSYPVEELHKNHHFTVVRGNKPVFESRGAGRPERILRFVRSAEVSALLAFQGDLDAPLAR